MKSIKCPQCGLVYWATDPNCKRCGLTTGDAAGADPASQPEQVQTQYAAYSQLPIMPSGDDAAKAKLLKNIKSDAIFFYVIGGLQISVWLFIGQLLIVDGVLNIGLSFLVHKFKSRVAAIFLLIVTLLAIVAGVAAIAAGETTGVLFPIAMIIRLLSAGRMVHSTFKLRNYAEEGGEWVLPPPPPSFQLETNQQWPGVNPAPQLGSAE